TTFGYGPYDQALPSSHVTGNEHAGNRAHVTPVASDVAALVERHAELLEPTCLLGPDETHRQEYDIRGQFAIAAFDLLEPTIHHPHLGEQHRANPALPVV